MSALVDWFALAMMAGVVVASVAAVTARALFALCLYVTVGGVLGASALLALGGGDSALALALLMAGLAPFLLLATLLLSARTVKTTRRDMPWLTIAGAVALGVAILFAAPDLKSAAPPQEVAAPIAFWLAPLMFVAVIAAIALLGYGERGQLERKPLAEREL